MTSFAQKGQDESAIRSSHGAANILIVDDIPDRLVAMEAVLDELGQNVMRAVSGREALRLVLQNDFAVILLDVNMPDLNGFETAAMIRSRRRSSHTPIIFVTAFGDETHAFQSYSLGAVDYIQTPVDPEILRAKVRVFVELFQKNEQLKQQSEQQAALRALADRRAGQLRLLATELGQTEQRERARLAQLLHDHIQQLLVAARMASKHVCGQLADDPLKHQLSAAIEFIDQSIAASRSLAIELSPPVLHQAGLGAALEWLGRWVQQNYGLQVDVSCARDAAPVPDEMRVTLFQAVRELLFNVVKHSGANRATVSLESQADGWLAVVVEDFGTGFDPVAAREELGRTGLGLFSVSERLECLGGRVQIDSAPGKGTRIRLSAPPEAMAARAPASAAASTSSVLPDSPPEITGDIDGATVIENRIRVLLVDDHAVVRAGLRGLLQNDPSLVVIAEAADGLEALRCVQAHRPDVVIMDINMPRMNGVEATRRIRADYPATVVVGMSLHEEEEIITSMIGAGAAAYVTKAGAPEVLSQVIREATAKIKCAKAV